MMTQDPGQIKQRLQQMCNMLRFSGEETVVLILHRLSGEKTILGSPAGITFLVTEKDIELKFKSYCDGWFKNGTTEQLPDVDELQALSDLSDDDFFDKDIEDSRGSKSDNIFQPFETNKTQYEANTFLSNDFYHLEARLTSHGSAGAKESPAGERFNDNQFKSDINNHVSSQGLDLYVNNQPNIPTIIQMYSPEEQAKPIDTCPIPNEHSALSVKDVDTPNGERKELEDVTFGLDITNRENDDCVEFVSKEFYKSSDDPNEQTEVNCKDAIRKDTKDNTAKKALKAKEHLICKICSKILSSMRNLNNHLKTHGPLICKVCQKPMSSVIKLNKHLQTHKTTAFCCKTCHTYFKDQFDLERHMMVHKKDNLMCEVCEATFTTVVNLRNHRSIHEETKQFKCTVCGLEFRLKSFLKQHMSTHNDVNRKVCNVCGKQYVSAKGLQIHMDSKHFKNKKYLCTFCNKEFYSQLLLNQHMIRKHRNKEFHCLYCDKVFKTNESLKAHENIHTKHKIYTCEFCGQIYFRYPSFRLHQRKHSDQYAPMKCPYCNIRFRSNFAMTAHVKHNHVIEDKSSASPVIMTCNICGKLFSNQQSFEAHMDMHAGIKRHKCGICGKGFSDPSNLRVHKRRHSNRTEVK